MSCAGTISIGKPLTAVASSTEPFTVEPNPDARPQSLRARWHGDFEAFGRLVLHELRRDSHFVADFVMIS
jgi:hypothetical protein